MPEERTPSSRQLLVDMVRYSRETAEQIGGLMASVEALKGSVVGIQERLESFATRDELGLALKGRSMRPREKATWRTMLPWVLGTITTLAAAVGGWLASG